MKTSALPPQLLALSRTVSEGCTQCRTCQIRCVFLREHGTPKDLADHLLGSGIGIARAFECSLCGLCQAVCPMHLPLPDFFLAMRRAALKNGAASLAPYRSLLNYETVGASVLFRLFALPPGGDTVLFPGCTFPAAHPRTALALYRHLYTADAALGLALSCCFKPSHDLGRQDFFASRFGTLRATLLARGVRTVLTACPNCFKVFTQYGDGLAVRSVLSALAENPPQGRTHVRGAAIMHTPCPLRFEKEVQDVALKFARESGLDVEKTRQEGFLGACCGEGGAVGALRPDYAATWTRNVEKGAQGRTIITTCAGCAKFISRRSRAIHLLDLIFFPQEAVSGTLPRPRGLRAYLHRLHFKWRVWIKSRSRLARG
jgi:Fe-S oxidoreductase